MKEMRINQIKASMKGLGTKANGMYTNDEIIDKLTGIQSAMANGIRSVRSAEQFHLKDVMPHFEALANEYGVKDTPEYDRLSHNMSYLGFTIASFKKGRSGEQKAMRALRVLTFDTGVEILHNIGLRDETSETEIDAVVITPYGVFMIEVKNFSGDCIITERGILKRTDDSGPTYDLGGKMLDKEFLLRRCLGDLSKVPYHGILLFADDNAKIQDHYGQIPVSYCNTVNEKIRSFNHGEVLTEDQITEIRNRLLANNICRLFPCKVNCEQIIDDYAVLMTSIEEAANIGNALSGEGTCTIEPDYTNIDSPEYQFNNADCPEPLPQPEGEVEQFDWKKELRRLGISAAAITLCLTIINNLKK